VLSEVVLTTGDSKKRNRRFPRGKKELLGGGVGPIVIRALQKGIEKNQRRQVNERAKQKDSNKAVQKNSGKEESQADGRKRRKESRAESPEGDESRRGRKLGKNSKGVFGPFNRRSRMS